jgi:hypothetical protein
MTPAQAEILELIERILRYYGMEGDFDTIRQLLVELFEGKLTPELAEAARKALLQWARERGDLLEAAMENALKLIGDAAGGTAGAITLPLLIPLLLVLAGIALPASRMGLGDPGLQSPFDAYFGDDCEAFYAALADAYMRLRRDYQAFTGGVATRQMASVLLKEASDFQDACARFHRRCPDSPRNGSVTRMQDYASTITSDVLDWLATH